MKTLLFKNQIFVVDYGKDGLAPRGRIVHTCDTHEEAADWIAQYGDPKIADAGHYSIDGTPEAWHEQFGYCGGSRICDCADYPKRVS